MCHFVSCSDVLFAHGRSSKWWAHPGGAWTFLHGCAASQSHDEAERERGNLFHASGGQATAYVLPLEMSWRLGTTS